MYIIIVSPKKWNTSDIPWEWNFSVLHNSQNTRNFVMQSLLATTDQLFFPRYFLVQCVTASADTCIADSSETKDIRFMGHEYGHEGR